MLAVHFRLMLAVHFRLMLAFHFRLTLAVHIMIWHLIPSSCPAFVCGRCAVYFCGGRGEQKASGQSTAAVFRPAKIAPAIAQTRPLTTVSLLGGHFLLASAVIHLCPVSPEAAVQLPEKSRMLDLCRTS